MAHKRVVRVISVEGIDHWVDAVLRRSSLRRESAVIFERGGTVKELQRIELGDGERIEGPLVKISAVRANGG